MGGVADFVRQVDPLGAKVADAVQPLAAQYDPLGNAILSGAGFGPKQMVLDGKGNPIPVQQQIKQRQMGQVQLSPFIQQYLAARNQGVPFQQMPVGQTVQPLAWRQQQMNPQQMQQPGLPFRPQQPYQNTGMFGQFNPFMPRR